MNLSGFLNRVTVPQRLRLLETGPLRTYRQSWCFQRQGCTFVLWKRQCVGLIKLWLAQEEVKRAIWSSCDVGTVCLAWWISSRQRIPIQRWKYLELNLLNQNTGSRQASWSMQRGLVKRNMASTSTILTRIGMSAGFDGDGIKIDNWPTKNTSQYFTKWRRFRLPVQSSGLWLYSGRWVGFDFHREEFSELSRFHLKQVSDVSRECLCDSKIEIVHKRAKGMTTTKACHQAGVPVYQSDPITKWQSWFVDPCLSH